MSIKEYFGEEPVSWEIIYYYFFKWSVGGSFNKVWIHLLKAYKSPLDVLSVQLDGSYTPCNRVGVAVGYQSAMSCKTNNSLFLCDNNEPM